MSDATVYLIGAGPGDPGLVSVRGLRYLATADVVLYDHHVNPRLLRHARADAELIDVGPAAPQPLEQQAIGYLLVEKAREGKTVARLKWGDPFVFDRGVEEALFLKEHGIRFTVVPGVPAAIGVPAYAGISITYPGGADTVTFVRGYEDERGRPPDVDWKILAELGGTVVCYTGGRQLPALLDALLANGWDATESAALIYRGTLSGQDTTAATVGELAALARRRGRSEPAILVIGRVVQLRDHLRWFDSRPLFGRRIVVTRPREQAIDLADRLESLGAAVIEAPLVRIAPPEDASPLDEVVSRVGTFDWIVFTSANGVDHFLRRVDAGPGDLRDLKGVRLAALGTGTADRLTRRGLKVDLRAPEYNVDAALGPIRTGGRADGLRVLMPRADIGRDPLADELRRSGAEVTEVAAYRVVRIDAEAPDNPDIYRMLLEKQVDVVTFTSASTVRALVDLYGAEPMADLLAQVTVASIGPVTAEAAERYGIRSAIVPAEWTIGGLVDAIVHYYGAATGGSAAHRT